MKSRTLVASLLLVLVSSVATAVHAASPSTPTPGRAGGVLKALTREDLTQGVLIHESSTLSTIWPAQPCGAVPGMVVTRVGVNFVDHLMLNHTRPPFNDVRRRRALSVAMDRAGFVKAVLGGGGVPGAALAPPPIGFWGLGGKDVPLGNDRVRARALLAEAGHGPSNPLKVEVVTRNIAIYRDGAAFVVDALRQVGVESTLRLIETAQWYGVNARREYQIGSSLAGLQDVWLDRR